MGLSVPNYQRALACNGLRHQWQFRHCEQLRICNLQTPLVRPWFESHPHRHAIYSYLQQVKNFEIDLYTILNIESVSAFDLPPPSTPLQVR